MSSDICVEPMAHFGESSSVKESEGRGGKKVLFVPSSQKGVQLYFDTSC